MSKWSLLASIGFITLTAYASDGTECAQISDLLKTYNTKVAAIQKDGEESLYAAADGFDSVASRIAQYEGYVLNSNLVSILSPRNSQITVRKWARENSEAWLKLQQEEWIQLVTLVARCTNGPNFWSGNF